MKTLRHMCIDIRGVLGWKDKDLKRLFRNTETGKPLTATEAKEYLYQKLKDGYDVLPMGDECEGFSKINGCPGHAVK